MCIGLNECDYFNPYLSLVTNFHGHPSKLQSENAVLDINTGK